MSTSRTREKADGELFKSTGIDDNATSTAITIDASENVGIGSTPATDWHSNYSVLQVGGQADIWAHKAVGTGKALHISHNAEYDTGFKYIASDEASLYLQGDGGKHIFSTAAAGTAGNAISFATKVQIDTDGLKFNGDTAAANALDDYEEGTFTPSGTGVKASSSVGIYTKIGRVCHCQIWIEADGTTVGHMSGLPFSQGVAPANYIAVGSVGFQNGTINRIMTTSGVGFYTYNGTSTGVLTSGQQLHCSLTYITT